MKSNASRVWMLILLAAVAVYGGYMLRKHYDRTQETPAPSASTANALKTGYAIADFTLVDQAGQPFHSRDMRGKVWVVGFFFSDCPGACVILNNQIASLLREDLKHHDVQFVSISVDPARDTPQVLSDYAAKFSGGGADMSRWKFLTEPNGKVPPIEAICEGFGLAYGVQTHSDRLVLVDQHGRKQGIYSGTSAPEVRSLVKNVNDLCAEDAAPLSDPTVEEL